MFLAPASPRRQPAALRRIFLTIACLAALLAPLVSRAQTPAPGTLDTSFTSVLVGSDFFALTLETVNDVEYLFAAGDFGSAGLEFAATGDLDTAFTLADFGVANRAIYTAVPEKVAGDLLGAPKILVGGLFGRNGTQAEDNEPGQNIKRILPGDGTLDPDFDPGSGANNFVTAILPLEDGTMIVAGEFDLFNKITHQHIVKLDNSGAIVDGSVFSSGLAFDATVLSLAEQYDPDGSGVTNGQILVGGVFGNVNGQGHTRLARLNADGSVDASFNPVFSDRVRIVVSQPDGKILAGGDFEMVNGTAVKHLVRLNYDGSLDTTFNALVTNMPPGIAAPVAVNTITPLGDGRFYIGGNFYEVNGVTRHYLARVLADGTVDDFDPGTTFSNTVQQVVIDPGTNEIYVGQNRDKSVNTKYPASLFRLFGDPVPSAVSVAAVKPTAKEAGLNGTPKRGVFELTRTGGTLNRPITVYLTLSNDGAARIGEDYTIPTSQLQPDGDFYTATFAADQTRLRIRVLPTGRAIDAPELITLTVQPDQNGTDNYFPATDANGNTVTISQ